MTDELEAIRARLRAELLAQARARREAPVELATATFDDFVGRHRIVLVDLWAAWCGPCHRMAPVIDELARAWAGRAAVAKVDTDAHPAIAQRYRVASIPTFLWFKGGHLAGRTVGVQPKAAFEAVLAELEAD